jgi:hypothetical protein
MTTATCTGKPIVGRPNEKIKKPVPFSSVRIANEGVVVS